MLFRSLLYGRMPQTAEECIIDSAMYGEAVLGEKILLSEDNEEDDLDYFAVKEFTIVGIAQSSLYIQTERGNTSIGNGKIVGFLYVPKDAFDTEFYTEILVKFDENHKIYSDQYDAYMDEKNKFHLEYAKPIVYSHGTYLKTGEELGTFGYSVKKK